MFDHGRQGTFTERFTNGFQKFGGEIGMTIGERSGEVRVKSFGGRCGESPMGGRATA